MIFQQIKEVFGALGVTEIEAEGVSFDPEKHNAVMHIEDEKYEENSVVEVFQTGFEVDGYVIRHAVVKVSNKMEQDTITTSQNPIYIYL